MFPLPSVFVRHWQLSNSITEVSVKLVKRGHKSMSPDRVRIWARTMREMGVKLKHMPRTSFPTVPLDLLRVTTMVN